MYYGGSEILQYFLNIVRFKERHNLRARYLICGHSRQPLPLVPRRPVDGELSPAGRGGAEGLLGPVAAVVDAGDEFQAGKGGSGLTLADSAVVAFGQFNVVATGDWKKLCFLNYIDRLS